LTERRLLLATGNPGKVREIRRSLRGLARGGRRIAVVGLDAAPVRGKPIERGRTFEANARAKALFYSRRWKGLAVAEDSGLEVAALAGAPGVRSARFSAPCPSDEKNIRKLLRLLEGVPPSARKARFVCVMALAENGRVIAAFRGQVRGRIALEPRGMSGFGYDPVFYYAPLRKTFAELPDRDKNEVSHRGRAVRKLRRFLEKKMAGPVRKAGGGPSGRGRPVTSARPRRPR